MAIKSKDLVHHIQIYQFFFGTEQEHRIDYPTTAVHDHRAQTSNARNESSMLSCAHTQHKTQLNVNQLSLRCNKNFPFPNFNLMYSDLHFRFKVSSSRRMPLSFATCTYSSQIINARHNNLHV